jgi:hypothetical protein
MPPIADARTMAVRRLRFMILGRFGVRRSVYSGRVTCPANSTVRVAWS